MTADSANSATGATGATTPGRIRSAIALTRSATRDSRSATGATGSTPYSATPVAHSALRSATPESSSATPLPRSARRVALTVHLVAAVALLGCATAMLAIVVGTHAALPFGIAAAIIQIVAVVSPIMLAFVCSIAESKTGNGEYWSHGVVALIIGASANLLIAGMFPAYLGVDTGSITLAALAPMSFVLGVAAIYIHEIH